MFSDVPPESQCSGFNALEQIVLFFHKNLRSIFNDCNPRHAIYIGKCIPL